MADFYLAVDKDKVYFDMDTGTHCCGENRYEWRTVGVPFSRKEFAEFVLRVLGTKHEENQKIPNRYFLFRD